MYEKSYGAEEVDTVQVTWIKVGPVLFPDGLKSDLETLLCSVGTKTRITTCIYWLLMNFVAVCCKTENTKSINGLKEFASARISRVTHV